MYKIVILDDEQEVRQGIINKINWSEFGFEVVGEAENGREALDVIEETMPDVVMTDICMPIMDGIELIAAINQSFPTVKVVILTGYDDFKYAQQAIKYNVSDYILKPILPEDIKDLLIKLKERIDIEISEKEDIIKLKQHYTETLPVLRESFLASLILIKPGLNEVERKIRSFDLKIQGNHFAVAVIGYDSESTNVKNENEWDVELKRFSILNIAQETINKHQIGEAFYFNNMPVIITGIKHEQRSVACNKIIGLMEEIRQVTERYLKITITIGVGSLCSSISSLNESYKAALAALDYKLILGGNKVIFVEDIEQKATETIVLDDVKERALVSSIKFGSRNDVILAIDALFSQVNTEKVSIKEYHLYIMEITAILLKLARSFGFATIKEIYGDHLVDLEINRFNTIDEAKSWMICVCVRLMEEISSQRVNKTQALFEKITDYIANNYGDSELGAQKVADHFYISTSYLALLFKKEANTTFLKHLIQVRLDAAIELLKRQDESITEVAEKVGYPDVSYFSYFFKKHLGVSPREFRNKGENDR